MKKIIFTIVSNNYLGSALSLYDSIVEHCQSDIDFICLLSDRKDENIKYDELKFNLMWPTDFLDQDVINEMAFKYDVVEYNTALKPFAIKYLMSTLDYERVYYFDPDTYLFDNIESIERYLEEKDIVLTPHIVDGVLGDELKENEEAILRNGIYNLGFLGVNKTSETEKIIEWWMSKLRNQCYNDKSYFVDQKWMNFITAYSDNVHILREKKYNVAKWNYHERMITQREGEFLVNGDKMCFFHFSGYKAGDIDTFIEQEFKSSDYKIILKNLFEIYREKLKMNRFDEFRRRLYCYNFYDNGMVISKLNRRLYRQLLDNGICYNNPFATGNNTFYDLMNKNGLLSEVYNTGELKAAISNAGSKDRLQKTLNRIMRIVKKVIGVRRYELLLGYFYNYCTIDNQIFLINENDLTNK